MRAPGWAVATFSLWALTAAADPKPTAIDVRPFKDRLLVFEDAQGGVYAVLRDSDPRVFYGTGGKLYEQLVTGQSSAGDATWAINMWTPRLPDLHRGEVEHRDDGTYRRYCDGLDDAGLQPVTGDKAKKLIASAAFLPSPNDHQPYLLARDDYGVYYYVDRLRATHQGYRVFIGKKGAMKLTPLADVAVDTAGAVFSTKGGELRLISSDHEQVKWGRGDKTVELHQLDVDVSSTLIFKDLGVYGFTGNLCENT